jgi:hypothetical protein
MKKGPGLKPQSVGDLSQDYSPTLNPKCKNDDNDKDNNDD